MDSRATISLLRPAGLPSPLSHTCQHTNRPTPFHTTPRPRSPPHLLKRLVVPDLASVCRVGPRLNRPLPAPHRVRPRASGPVVLQERLHPRARKVHPEPRRLDRLHLRRCCAAAAAAAAGGGGGCGQGLEGGDDRPPPGPAADSAAVAAAEELDAPGLGVRAAGWRGGGGWFSEGGGSRCLYVHAWIWRTHSMQNPMQAPMHSMHASPHADTAHACTHLNRALVQLRCCSPAHSSSGARCSSCNQLGSWSKR